MAALNQIRWGSYEGFEGPFYSGQTPFIPEKDPDFLGKIVQVVCATEGGRYDAINMYDQCILSVGILQVCEKVHEFSNMLSYCAKTELATINEAAAKLPAPLELRPNGYNPMRFFFLDGSGMVDDAASMRRAYLGGSSGLKGQWTEPQKTWAKQVAVVMADMWQSDSLRQMQLGYVKGRMFGFALPRARNTIMNNPNKNAWSGALQAMYISYAANLPALADKCLAKAESHPKWLTTDESKFRIYAQEALKSGVDIWPRRYKDISPSLSTLFNVKVPTLEELAASINQDFGPVDQLTSVAGLQNALIALGYDLGPSGADGKYGTRTKQAVADLQTKYGLDADGVVGPRTRELMLKLIGTT